MKTSLYILFITAAIVVAAVGCTRNNGNIGSWFGTWRVVGIEVDDVPLDSYTANVIVKFQNDIIETMEVYDHHDTESYYATWHSTGSELVIDGRERGIAPELMLPANSVVTLNLLRAPEDVMEWEYVGGGTVIRYNLKKLY